MSNKLRPNLKTVDKPEVEFTFGKLKAFADNCNVMKTFTKTTFLNLRKFQKNFVKATDKLEEASIESTMINERTEKLNEEYKDNYENPKYLEFKKELMGVIKEFNERKLKLKIFVMPTSDFPNDVEFVEKAANDSKFIKSYLELLDVCIIGDDLSDD